MRKELTKQKRLWIGGLTLLLALALLVGSAIAVTAANNAGESESAREYFSFPSEVVSTGTVGVKTPVARITPSDDQAQNYVYSVFFDGNAIDAKEYSFLPEKAGDYTVRYHYLSGGKVRSYSYTIAVTAADGPVFDSTPIFPHAFISGKTYSLPVLSAADWSSGEKNSAEITTSVTIDGQELTVTDGKFVPTLESEFADTEIVYTATVGGKSATVSATVPVLKVYGDDDTVDLKGLFATRGFDNVTATANFVAFRSFGDAEIRYANILGSNGMSIEFGFGAERYQAESLVLTVESYVDPSVAVSIAFEKGRRESGEGLLRLNGGNTVKKYDFAANEKFTVTLDEDRSRLVGAGGALLFNLTEDINGAKFTGFPGGLVKVKIEVKGSYGSCELCVYKINSQNISSYEYDEVLPTVTFPAIPNEYLVGSTITVPAVHVIDVVDPNATLVVSVRKFSTYLTDVDGVVLNKVDATKPLTFKAEESGSITVQYNVNDTSGNSYTYPLILEIIDRTAPNVEVNGSISSTVKVGATVKLPSATATDNDGIDGILMQIVVVCPNSYVKLPAFSSGTGMLDVTEFTFDIAGEYKIWYVATDEFGNYARKEFIVKAEA